MRIIKRCFVAIVVAITFIKCAAQKTTGSIEESTPIAFPGAEGYGKYATGGRGGKVFIVTNLNDDGEGSFRKAATTNGPRIIVFAVSGTIHLNTSVSIKANATVAGQTAPGDGICFADKSVQLGGDNIIVRYLRFRLGDKFQRQAGQVDGSGGEDAFGGGGKKHIVIDHCTFSWSNDECFSVYNGDSTTFQWNIISEPLNYSYHFETGDKDWEHHGYGGIWGGKHLTAHHNLFAHCNSRNPRFNGNRQGIQEFVDYVNNVIYDWGGNTIYAGEGGNYNIINNYFKYGPSTNKSVWHRVVNPGRTETIPFGKWYVNGNYVDEAKDVSKNNWLGIVMGNGGTEDDKKNTVINDPHPTDKTNIETAEGAYQSVLKFAGASFRRDTLDARIINDVVNRTGFIIDVQGRYPAHSPFDMTLSAWPALKSLPAAVDNDKDGIPDEWERKNGLNPADASDASKVSAHNFYTNIEVYINSIVK